MERVQLPDCIGKPMCYSVAVATTSSQCSLDSFLIDWKLDANMYIQLRFSQAPIIKPLYPSPNYLQETLNACAWDTLSLVAR